MPQAATASREARFPGERGRELSEREIPTMIRYPIAALALGAVIGGTPALADPDQPTRLGTDKEKTVYVQLIVKACRGEVIPLEPTGHGKVYNDEKPMTREERRAALVATGCIDVPVPMEFLNEGMSATACNGRGGYIASMQFLQQRQDLRDFPAVGAWQCIVTDHEVVGISTM